MKAEYEVLQNSCISRDPFRKIVVVFKRFVKANVKQK